MIQASPAFKYSLINVSNLSIFYHNYVFFLFVYIDTNLLYQILSTFKIHLAKVIVYIKLTIIATILQLDHLYYK